MEEKFNKFDVALINRTLMLNSVQLLVFTFIFPLMVDLRVPGQ
jgi:hypothetical protein